MIETDQDLGEVIEVLLAEDQEVVQDLAAEGLMEPFHEGLQIGRAERSLQDLAVGRLDLPVEGGGELGLAIVLDVELRRLVGRQLPDGAEPRWHLHGAEFNTFACRPRAVGLVENPFRTGSWGRIGNGKFHEVVRIDIGDPMKGRNQRNSHLSIDGVGNHLPVNTPFPGE